MFTKEKRKAFAAVPSGEDGRSLPVFKRGIIGMDTCVWGQGSGL